MKTTPPSMKQALANIAALSNKPTLKIHTPMPATKKIATVAPVPVAPVALGKPKAILISEKSLEFFNNLKAEFVGPGATKETPMTSEEAFELLVEVATSSRHTVQQAVDEETGEELFDADGLPETVAVDLFEIAAHKIFANRNSLAKQAKIERLKAQLAALGG